MKPTLKCAARRYHLNVADLEALLDAGHGVCPLTGLELDLEDPDALTFRSLDHIVPKSLGGPDTIENLAFVAKKANDLRGNATVAEFKYLFEKAVTANRGDKIAALRTMRGAK